MGGTKENISRTVLEPDQRVMRWEIARIEGDQQDNGRFEQRTSSDGRQVNVSSTQSRIEKNFFTNVNSSRTTALVVPQPTPRS